MVAQQEDFNARVNLLMSVEVGDLHDVLDHQSHDLLDPWLGNYLGIFPSHLFQVPMWCEHCIVILVSQVEITDLESWDQSQLWFDCTYPLQEVQSDQRVLEITWDTVTTKRSIQGRGVVGQDR
jgi:hypothetical protein